MQSVHISDDRPRAAADWATVLDAIESRTLSPSALTDPGLYRAYEIGYRFAETTLLPFVTRTLQLETEAANLKADLVRALVDLEQTRAEIHAIHWFGPPRNQNDLEQRLARAEFEADMYYELWLFRKKNPSDRRRLTEMRRRRVDQALAEAADSEEPVTEGRQAAISVRAALPLQRPAA